MYVLLGIKHQLCRRRPCKHRGAATPPRSRVAFAVSDSRVLGSCSAARDEAMPLVRDRGFKHARQTLADRAAPCDASGEGTPLGGSPLKKARDTNTCRLARAALHERSKRGARPHEPA